MGDLISRQKVIEAIVNSPSRVQDENMPLTDKYDGATFRQIEILGIIDTLPSAEPKWIPVTERLPEEKVEVLVTVEVDGKKYIENGMLSGVYHGQWETIYDRYEIDVYGRNRNSKVIAWMPLPDCYDENE